MSTGIPFLLSSLASSGAADAPYTIDDPLPGAPLVDNARFHYFVRVTPTSPGWTGTFLQVLGVTIEYTMELTPGS
jgi:hypothetical protein